MTMLGAYSSTDPLRGSWGEEGYREGNEKDGRERQEKEWDPTKLGELTPTSPLKD